MDDDLIAAHGELPALMPCVHLPVQSGSDRILAAMNRRHTRRDYLAVIDRLRIARMDLAFTSDFIVGFPGETETDFRDTLALIDNVGFAGAYSFTYSPRPGTPAAEINDQIPQEEKSERLQRLQASIVRHQRAFNAGFFGQTLDVLLEKPGKLAGQLVGRSPHLLAVQVMAPTQFIGSVKRVIISKIGTNSLFGTLAHDESFVRPLATAGA
jgi:tRNA-2-methylthio-N6-dimethylallyladenosine synthase